MTEVRRQVTMLAREFLDWIDRAPAGHRAIAARALCRFYLQGTTDAEVSDAMEAALTILLDDPAPEVRRALAEVLGASPSRRRTTSSFRLPSTCPRSPSSCSPNRRFSSMPNWSTSPVPARRPCRRRSPGASRSQAPSPRRWPRSASAGPACDCSATPRRRSPASASGASPNASATMPRCARRCSRGANCRPTSAR